MSTDEKSQEAHRRKHVNKERAEKLQVALDSAGYFKLPRFEGRSLTEGAIIPVHEILVNVLVDYLHFASKEKQRLDLPTFQELVKIAYDLFERENYRPE